ncbi:MAG: SRPBCC domain-containing protein [Candidatus Woykebacteria bacterium]
MLSDQTFREWTKTFSPDPHFVGSWEEDSEIRFLGSDPKTGEQGGMFSRIRENKKYEYLSIEHQVIIENGQVDTTSEKAKKWAPSYENYTFKEENGSIEVTVDVDVDEEIISDFEKMWPAALAKLKEISEK